jgi:hypothetical protein
MKARANITIWITATAALNGIAYPIAIPMSMNGSAETPSAITPSRIRGGDASAAVNSPPTTMTGRTAASPSIPVDNTCASTRAIPGAGSVRR